MWLEIKIIFFLIIKFSFYANNTLFSEVKDAYHQKYIDGNIGKITWEQARKNHNGSVNDHIPNDKGPLSPEVTSKLPPLEVTPEEAALIGYMPFRDDYNRVRSKF